MRDNRNPLTYVPPARLRLVGIIAAVVLGVIVVIGLITRFTESRATAAWTDANAVPPVSVINLGATAKSNLVLPGTVQAFNSAQIFARVSGYLKKWYVDIGAPVKAGQLLAEIDVPDQDAQLAQARADLNTALANQHLSAETARRWNLLAKQNAVAPQDVDEKNADLAAKTAMVASTQQNVQRLQDLTRFKSITAPFDGTVTSRGVDVGALVTVGTGTTGATPLFTVADDSKIRIYVSVPQNYSNMLKTGMVAHFTVPQHPGEVFTATLAASAESVSSQTGTVLLQLQADNPGDLFHPGDYAQVTFNLPASTTSIQIPASALIFGDNGTEVAVVGPGNKVVIKPVTIVRDFGTSVEIAAATLARNDRVIDNPSDSLRQGDEIRIATGSKS